MNDRFKPERTPTFDPRRFHARHYGLGDVDRGREVQVELQNYVGIIALAFGTVNCASWDDILVLESPDEAIRLGRKLIEEGNRRSYRDLMESEPI